MGVWIVGACVPLLRGSFVVLERSWVDWAGEVSIGIGDKEGEKAEKAS